MTLTTEGQLYYTGDILPREISVIGEITKTYNKNSTVNTSSLFLYEICQGDTVLFSGIYTGGQYTVCSGYPVAFTLAGADAPNYTLIGDYYGDITPLNITVNGNITKVYDKTDTVNTSPLSLSYNLDGANLYFTGVYSD